LAESKNRRLRAGFTTTRTATHGTPELSAEEERVVRIQHGLGAEAELVLPRKVSSDPEVNARLMMIEAALLAEMHGRGPLVESDDNGQPQSPKEKILNHLRQIEASKKK
jgi:hypothetical protein